MASPKHDVKRVKLSGSDAKESSVEKLHTNFDLIINTDPQRSKYLRLFFNVGDKSKGSSGHDVLTTNYRLGVIHQANPGMVEEIPDHDVPTMKNILSVIYGANPALEDLPAPEIQNIAMLAHKYAMTPLLGFAGSCWLNDYPFDDPEDYWLLLTAANWFRHSQQFHELSMSLGGMSGLSLLRWASETPDVSFGLRLALTINEIREVKSSWGTKGLCLNCFKTAKISFLARGEHCMALWFH
ncbi:hypothetical protein QQZ08_004184 [Neonectria magnoliae]|uniref:BTB domain-containing protein n=1 Tax=Neonectria magnoliae TaxID=2732573 RepID=A0ABR1I794_9HYPO